MDRVSPGSSRHQAGHSGQGTLPWQCAFTPILILRLRLGWCRHSNSPNCTSMGCGRKPESMEKTHADVGRTCPLFTNSGLGCTSVFLSHQCYHETVLNKTVLFEGGLAILCSDIGPHVGKTARRASVCQLQGTTFSGKKRGGPAAWQWRELLSLLPSVDRSSDFLGKLKNPDFHVKFLHFKMPAMNKVERATQKATVS